MNEYTDNFKRGDFLIRGLMGIDPQNNAGVIADLVKPGQTVQFHLRDAKTAHEDLNALLSNKQLEMKDEKPQGALVFCCNGRGEYLFRQKNHDIEIIQKYLGPLPAAGFFCAGEIGPVGKNNFLHGFTNSIALFFPAKN
jgi:small ligand-binding sensory domain FIST